MEKLFKTTKVILLFGALIGLLVACGGGSKAKRSQQGGMDTPDYHVLRGDEAIAKKSFNAAKNSYQKALDLDANYSPAYSGKAVAEAKIIMHNSSSKRQKELTLEKVETQIDTALDKAKNNEEKVRAHAFAIDVYLTMKLPQGEWYEKAKDHYDEAIELSPNSALSHLLMARAESVKHNYGEASRLYNKVLSLNQKFTAEANAELEIVQKVQRARPGSRFGRELAFIPKMARADIAALFIAELRLDRLYKDRVKKFDTSFQSPQSQQSFQADKVVRASAAMDITGHPMEDAIKEIIQLNVKGLEPDASHKFHPDKEITRAEYALMIADILSKVTQDKSLATKYIGTESPFPDVRSDVYYYNAARLMVDRGLMKVKSKTTGEFGAQDPVMGADALLTIRDLKEVLQSYLR